MGLVEDLSELIVLLFKSLIELVHKVGDRDALVEHDRGQVGRFFLLVEVSILELELCEEVFVRAGQLSVGDVWFVVGLGQMMATSSPKVGYSAVSSL